MQARVALPGEDESRARRVRVWCPAAGEVRDAAACGDGETPLQLVEEGDVCERGVGRGEEPRAGGVGEGFEEGLGLV